MQVPVWEKYMLTIKEASQYFHIGENKMLCGSKNQKLEH